MHVCAKECWLHFDIKIGEKKDKKIWFSNECYKLIFMTIARCAEDHFNNLNKSHSHGVKMLIKQIDALERLPVIKKASVTITTCVLHIFEPKLCKFIIFGQNQILNFDQNSFFKTLTARNSHLKSRIQPNSLWRLRGQKLVRKFVWNDNS